MGGRISVDLSKKKRRRKFARLLLIKLTQLLGRFLATADPTARLMHAIVRKVFPIGLWMLKKRFGERVFCILATRHGRTVGTIPHGRTVRFTNGTKAISKGRVTNGRGSDPLTLDGHAGARTARRWLQNHVAMKGIRPRAIKFVSSCTERALETARIIGTGWLGEPLQSPFFQEMDWGVLTMAPRAEANRRCPRVFSDPFARCPWGESHFRAGLRALFGLFLLLWNLEEETHVVLVSHGATLAALYALIQYRRIDQHPLPKIPVSAFTRITVDLANGQITVANANLITIKLPSPPGQRTAKRLKRYRLGRKSRRPLR